MNYLYQAEAYDGDLAEVSTWLTAANGRIQTISKPVSAASSGNIREDALAKVRAYEIRLENARIDAENKRVWIQTLSDCENYFTEFFKTAKPFYEFIYSPDIKPFTADNDKEITSLSPMELLSLTSYALYGVDVMNKTINLGFDAAIFPLETPWFKAAEQTVQAVLDGLNATGRKKAWGLEDWPRTTVTASPFTNRNQSIDITVELLDENKRSLGSTDISFPVGWECDFHLKKLRFSPLYPDAIVVAFNSIRIEDVTDTLTIRVVRVNGVDAETAAKNGDLQITASKRGVQRVASHAKANQARNKLEPVQLSVGGFVPIGMVGAEVTNHPQAHQVGLTDTTESSLAPIFGISIFADITYIEADVGIGFEGFTFSALGKFPFSMNKNRTLFLFPAAGVMYLNKNLFFQGGIGLDTGRRHGFFRTELLYTHAIFHNEASFLDKSYTLTGGGFVLTFGGGYRFVEKKR
jgi:hypothetical protein